MCIDTKSVRDEAKRLYIAGYLLTEISKRLSVEYSTVASWKRRGEWDEVPALKKIHGALEARAIQLMQMDDKPEWAWKELTWIYDQQRKNELHQAKLDNYQGGKTTDKSFNKKLGKRGAKPAKEKNVFTDEQVEALDEAFLTGLFDYQKHWYKNLGQAIRNILKSRQIGATWYFAREAITDAVKTGRSKIFLSASKAQAGIFREYIKDFVRNVTEVELTGTDVIELWNGAKIRFLSTNSATAQGYNGDVYVDEYFYIPHFQKLRKLASGMASQKKWNVTYFSTPSTINHEAYPYWTGEFFNKGRAKANQINLDVSHKALKNGRLCEDGQWRQIVTIYDAVEKGATDLFDIDQLKLEYPPDEFKNLFMGKFVDDSHSVFKFEDVAACGVDAQTKAGWWDYNKALDRPFGNRKVWLGFDPSRWRDAASCVVIAPPSKPGGKFRILEKYQWHGASFEYQANRIKELTQRFNVAEIAIDKTGLGEGVIEHVKKFFPRLKTIDYSQSVKNELVSKGLDVVLNKRLEFPAEWFDLIKAFMTIYKTSTDSGLMTYKARRTDATGHADLVFALLHALSFEHLDATGKKKGRVRRTR